MKRAKDELSIVQTVALNVRVKRKAAGLSQEELAYEAGIDRTYVSQVERGLRNLTISVLARIAKALKTSPDKLLIPGAPPVVKRAVSSKNSARTSTRN
jgi:transcriptional regulator with XRE-family HTH domain